MNNNYLHSLSPPSEDSRVPLKRQKMDIINLPKLDPSTIEPVSEEEWSGLTRELLVLRRNLLQTEVTLAQFRKVRVQIEEVMREEERNLEVYLRMNRETTKQLEVALGTTVWSAHEVREAEANAETEMFKIKIRMREKITNLLTENSQVNAFCPEDTPTLPMIPSNESEIKRELREAEKTIRVTSSHILKGQRVSYEFDHKIEKASMKSQQLHSERAHLKKKPTILSKAVPANEFEGKIQSERYIIPTLRKAEDNLVLKEHTVRSRQGLEDEDNVEQQVMFFPGKSDELPSSLQYHESREGETWSAALANERPPPPSVKMSPIRKNQRADDEKPALLRIQSNAFLYPADNEGPTAKAENFSRPCLRFNQHGGIRRVERTCQDLRVMVGSYYALVSDPVYFKVDWTKYYIQTANREYVCNKCLVRKDRKLRMEDHIWCHHYGGRFTCPLCPNPSPRETRDSIRQHMKKHHGNVSS